MPGMDATTGRALAERDHILQSISNLVRTPVGTRVQRRTYGSLIPSLIDQPLSTATLLRLYSATAAAIMAWEPRATVSEIALSFNSTGETLLVLELVINNAAVSSEIPVEGV